MVDSLWPLPDGWEWVALDKVCKLYGGGTPERSHSEYFDGDIVWVTPTDLDINNPIQEIYDSKTKITQLGLNSSSAKLVPEGTVLFSSRATIGKIGIASVALCTNQGFANFVCNQGLNNHYLAWTLKRFTENIKKLASSTTYLEINRGNFRKFKIPIPYPNNPKLSLDIQQRIVARIESLLGEIKHNRLLLEQMRQDTDELMDAALNEVFLLNNTFNKVALNQKCQVIMGQSPPGKTYSNTPIGLPLLNGPKEFGTYHPTPIQWTSEPTKICEPDDLLICVRGATTGRTNWADQRYCIGRGIAAIRSQNKQNTDIRFIAHFIQSQAIKILKAGRGSTFPNISKSDLEDWKIPDIDINDQKQLVSHFDFLQNEIKKIDLMLKEDEKNFNYLEQAILEKAFRGEL